MRRDIFGAGYWRGGKGIYLPPPEKLAFKEDPVKVEVSSFVLPRARRRESEDLHERVQILLNEAFSGRHMKEPSQKVMPYAAL